MMLLRLCATLSNSKSVGGACSMSTMASRSVVAAALDGGSAFVSRSRARTQRSGSPRAAGATTARARRARRQRLLALCALDSGLARRGRHCGTPSVFWQAAAIDTTIVGRRRRDELGVDLARASRGAAATRAAEARTRGAPQTPARRPRTLGAMQLPEQREELDERVERARHAALDNSSRSAGVAASSSRRARNSAHMRSSHSCVRGSSAPSTALSTTSPATSRLVHRRLEHRVARARASSSLSSWSARPKSNVGGNMSVASRRAVAPRDAPGFLPLRCGHRRSRAAASTRRRAELAIEKAIGVERAQQQTPASAQ
jgi:hypothetical protein